MRHNSTPAVSTTFLHIEPQFWRDALHGTDYVTNMLIQRQAEELRALFNVLALDRRGERFLLHLLAHAAGRHSPKLFGPHVSDGSDETAKFIYREQRFPQWPVQRILIPIPLRM